MTDALVPVPFSKRKASAPRLTPKYVSGRTSRRFWSEEEKAVLREHYEAKGGDYCAALLPGRDVASCYQQARKLGLKRKDNLGWKPSRKRIGDVHDEEIRRQWPSCTKKGDVRALADRLKIPRHWLTDRATKLGLTMPHKKEPPWSAAEDALLLRVPLFNPDRASEIFRQHGFARSPAALTNRCKRLHVSRRYDLTFSASAAARVLGVDSKWITARCIDGSIRASRRGTKRLPQQGGDSWSIERAELRRFAIECIDDIDIRKVDKFAFVDLLTRQEPPECS